MQPILEILPSGNAMLLRAGVGWHPGLVRHALLSLNDPSYKLITKQPCIITQTRVNTPALLAEHGIINGVSVPILGVEGTYGVLGIYTGIQRVFTPDDVNFLQTIANLLSIAVEKHQYTTSLRKTQEQLENKLAQRTAELVEINESLQSELREAQTQECWNFHTR